MRSRSTSPPVQEGGGAKTGERLTTRSQHVQGALGSKAIPRQPRRPLIRGHIRACPNPRGRVRGTSQPVPHGIRTNSEHLVAAKEHGSVVASTEAAVLLCFLSSPFSYPWSASRRGPGGSSQLLPEATTERRGEGGGWCLAMHWIFVRHAVPAKCILPLCDRCRRRRATSDSKQLNKNRPGLNEQAAWSMRGATVTTWLATP